MKINDPGHRYFLDTIDGYSPNTLTFVKRFRGDDNHGGTTNQEVIRVLIDRVKFLDAELPWEGNEEIIHHLRMALVLHEARALVRKVEKGDLYPENVDCAHKDGHFSLLVE